MVDWRAAGRTQQPRRMSTHTLAAPLQTTTTRSLVERAAELGPQLAENATRHDRDGTFVADSYDALRRAGLLRAAVPVELGGDGIEGRTGAIADDDASARRSEPSRGRAPDSRRRAGHEGCPALDVYGCTHA